MANIFCQVKSFCQQHSLEHTIHSIKNEYNEIGISDVDAISFIGPESQKVNSQCTIAAIPSGVVCILRGKDDHILLTACEKLGKYSSEVQQSGRLGTFASVAGEIVLHATLGFSEFETSKESPMALRILELHDTFQKYSNRILVAMRRSQCISPFIQAFPKTSENRQQLTQALRNMLDAIGIRCIGIVEKQSKTNFCFSIINQGYSTDDSWRSFVVYIEADEVYVTVKTVFTLYQEKFQATDPDLKLILQRYVARVNNDLQIGHFGIDTKTHLISFETKCIHVGVNPAHYMRIIKPLFTINVSTYKTYGYGLVNLINAHKKHNITEANFYKLVMDCEMRKVKAPMLPRKQVDVERFPVEAEEMAKERYIHSKIKESEYLRAQFKFETIKLQSNEIMTKIDKECLFINSTSCLNADQFKYVLLEVIVLLLHCFDIGIIFEKLPLKNIAVEIQAKHIKVSLVPFKLYKYTTQSAIPKENISAQLHQQAFEYTTELLYSQDTDCIPAYRFKYPKLTDVNLAIGKGGFSYIFRNQLEGRCVALKMLQHNRESSEDREVKKEYKLLNDLTHENVVECIGLASYNQTKLIILEFCHNQNLKLYLNKAEKLPIQKRLEIVQGVAHGLQYIHSKNIGHFDLKPHNVLLRQDLTPAICDFGLSEIVKGERNRRSKGFTLAYCAPEQIKGSKYGFECDIWSLGILIYHVLTLQEPYAEFFVGKDKKGCVPQFLHEIKMKNMRPSIPEKYYSKEPELVSLITSCLEYKPSNRPKLDQIINILNNIITTRLC